jgi:hypothetical protein
MRKRGLTVKHPGFLDVFKTIVEMWAEGTVITQHEVALRLGYRETKHVWSHVKDLEKIGVVKRMTYSFSHVEFLFLAEVKGNA